MSKIFYYYETEISYDKPKVCFTNKEKALNAAKKDWEDQGYDWIEDACEDLTWIHEIKLIEDE
jgi:hypothetical protein